jgi:hypothetical protein
MVFGSKRPAPGLTFDNYSKRPFGYPPGLYIIGAPMLKIISKLLNSIPARDLFPKTSRLLYAEQLVKRRPGIDAVDGKPAAFMSRVDPLFKEVLLYEYENVKITPEGNVIKGLRIDRDLFIYPAHARTYNGMHVVSTLLKRKRINTDPGETYLVCHDYWSNNVFHWMCDVMSRVEAVKDLTPSLVLLLPDFFRLSYFHEMLAAYQFKRIMYYADSDYIFCKKLLVPAHVATSGRIPPENTVNLRATLLAHFKQKFTGTLSFSRLYISRNKAQHRKVLNEQLIAPLLERYNYKIVYFEDHTVAQQVELCYNASVIVSIHGANLTNTIFMQPGGYVGELRKKGDLDNNYFYELADSVGCGYFSLDCDFDDPIPGQNYFNLIPEAGEFERMLQLIEAALSNRKFISERDVMMDRGIASQTSSTRKP